MTRGRVNAAATVPEGGAARVHANLIATWEEASTLQDREEAIKAAAREAIRRVREVSS